MTEVVSLLASGLASQLWSVIVSNEVLKPWLRQADESETEYLRFRVWLMSSWSPKRETSRNITKAAEYLKLSRGGLDGLKLRRDWNSRAAAYDTHLMAMHATGTLADLDDMRARQNRVLSVAMSVLEKSLESLNAALDSTDKKRLDGIKYDLPKLMDTVLKYQNLLYGQSTENVNAKATVEFGEEWDLTHATLEELDWLAAFRSRLQKRKAGS